MAEGPNPPGTRGARATRTTARLSGERSTHVKIRALPRNCQPEMRRERVPRELDFVQGAQHQVRLVEAHVLREAARHRDAAQARRLRRRHAGLAVLERDRVGSGNLETPERREVDAGVGLAPGRVLLRADGGEAVADTEALEVAVHPPRARAGGDREPQAVVAGGVELLQDSGEEPETRCAIATPRALFRAAIAARSTGRPSLSSRWTKRRSS